MYAFNFDEQAEVFASALPSDVGVDIVEINGKSVCAATVLGLRLWINEYEDSVEAAQSKALALIETCKAKVANGTVV